MAKKLYFSSNHDELPIELRSDTVPVGESLTVQSERDETDVNLIMQKYTKYGILPEVKNSQPFFSDEVIQYYGDYHAHVHKIRAAESYFDSLPSELREYFENSVQNLATWLSNPDNADEAVKLGLVPAPAAPAAPAAPEAVDVSTPDKPKV
jgi:hypothetical protein